MAFEKQTNNTENISSGTERFWYLGEIISDIREDYEDLIKIIGGLEEKGLDKESEAVHGKLVAEMTALEKKAFRYRDLDGELKKRFKEENIPQKETFKEGAPVNDERENEIFDQINDIIHEVKEIDVIMNGLNKNLILLKKSLIKIEPKKDIDQIQEKINKLMSEKGVFEKELKDLQREVIHRMSIPYQEADL